MKHITRYEFVVILLSDLSDDAVKAEIGKIEAITKAHAGSIVSSDVWGRRQLAYKINKREYGIYVLLVVEGDYVLASDLDRQLKINESVLRHLIVKKDKHAPDASPRLKEEPSRDRFGAGDDDGLSSDFGDSIGRGANL